MRMLGIPAGVGELLTPGVRWRFVLSVVFSFGLALLDMLGVLATVPLMQFVATPSSHDGVLGVFRTALGNPPDSAILPLLAGTVVGAFLLKDMIAILVRRWQLRFMAAQEVALSTHLLEGYLAGPYEWHLKRNTSDKLWTIGTAVNIGFTNGISSVLNVVTESLTLLLLGASLIIVAPAAGASAIGFLAVASILMNWTLRRRLLHVGRLRLRASQAAAKASLEGMAALKEIKLRSAQPHFLETYRSARESEADAVASASLLGEMPKYLLEMIFIAGVALLAWALAASDGASALALIGVFLAAGTRIIPSAARLLGAFGAIRVSREPLSHLVRERRSLEMERRLAEAAQVTDAIPDGDLAVKNLEFAYQANPDDPVLKGIDLEIPSGSSLAVVGTSGAGKTTLVDLLLGLLTPTNGTISSGAVSIFDNVRGWQSRVAAVPQDVHLLDATLRENICFTSDFDPALMDEVIRKAQLDDVLAELPDGLETAVGERGSRLSGGQRQRIGIARALYRRPSVLFLDEATSALDNETEYRFSRAIDALKGSMTVVIVAHRLSTVRHCDQLIFMKDGRVATSGTFDEVADQNAEFARLVELGSLD